MAIENGLVGYYSFDKGLKAGGGTTAPELYIVGSTTQLLPKDGRNEGGCLQFFRRDAASFVLAAVADYPNFDFEATYTVQVWARINQPVAEEMVLIEKYDGFSNKAGWTLTILPGEYGKIRIDGRGNVGVTQGEEGPPYKIDHSQLGKAWNHVVATRTHAMSKGAGHYDTLIYLNGSLVASRVNETATHAAASNRPLCIGARWAQKVVSDGEWVCQQVKTTDGNYATSCYWQEKGARVETKTEYPFIGHIDSVALWNRGFSAAEVTQLFNEDDEVKRVLS